MTTNEGCEYIHNIKRLIIIEKKSTSSTKEPQTKYLENGDRKDRSRSSYGKKLFLGDITQEQKSFLEYYDSKEAANYSIVREEDMNLFDSGEEFALAHCVAEDMNMGSGIAVEFRLVMLISREADLEGLRGWHSTELKFLEIFFPSKVSAY